MFKLRVWKVQNHLETITWCVKFAFEVVENYKFWNFLMSTWLIVLDITFLKYTFFYL